MVDVSALTAALAAVSPCVGVSVADPADRSTWRVDYSPAPTDAQRQAAVAVVAGWTDPAAIPASVTNYQARTILIQRGLLAKVDAAIRGADQTVQANQIALAAWDYANTFERSSPLIDAMAQVLGLSSTDVDALFIAAAALS